MAYNTTVSLDKLSLPNYEDFGKCQDTFEQFSWSNSVSNYMDEKLRGFKKDHNKEFQLVQNLTMQEAEFSQLMRLRNRLIIAAENIAREKNLSPVLLPTMSKDMDEHFKLAHKVVDVVDQANRKSWGTLLRYNVDKPHSSCAQVRLFARNKEDEKFQQTVYVVFKLEEFIYLLDSLNSVFY